MSVGEAAATDATALLFLLILQTANTELVAPLFNLMLLFRLLS